MTLGVLFRMFDALGIRGHSAGTTYRVPDPTGARALEDELTLGHRVAAALDDENNCRDAWLPCWCARCCPDFHEDVTRAH